MRRLIEQLLGRLPQPRLTRARISLALVVAAVADALQIPFQALPPVPEIIDVIAMVLTTWIIGFHILLLPTFVLELIHFVDVLPTWLGCVITVIVLRRREQGFGPPPPVTEPIRLPIEPPLIAPPSGSELPPKIPPATGA